MNKKSLSCIEDVIKDINLSKTGESPITTIKLVNNKEGILTVTYKGLTKLGKGDTIKFFVEDKNYSVVGDYDSGCKDRFGNNTGLIPMKEVKVPFSREEEAYKILKIVNGEVAEKYYCCSSHY